MCPTNYNPSDYIMHLSQTETQESLLAKGMFQFDPLTVNPMAGTISYLKLLDDSTHCYHFT